MEMTLGTAILYYLLIYYKQTPNDFFFTFLGQIAVKGKIP